MGQRFVPATCPIAGTINSQSSKRPDMGTKFCPGETWRLSRQTIKLDIIALFLSFQLSDPLLISSGVYVV